MKSAKIKFTYILALFALLVISLCPNTSKGSTCVYAAENVTSLDSMAVMDDLQGTDLSAIEQELKGDGLYVISFMEYAFAYNVNANGNFGLYVYVYNPTQKPVIENTTQHKINLGVKYENTEVKGYDKFTLRCLSVSEDGKYVKFKVLDKVSEVTGETILARVSKSKLQRIYDVAEVEICHKYGEIADSYAVGKRYICTGFAQGYGQNAQSPSTLDVFSEKAKTIQLDVHPTQYRLSGNNGKNLYTQDMLHSVYFTVPKEYSEEYGEMTAVHAHWLNALLKPMLVMGNQAAYNAIELHLGEVMAERNASDKPGHWGGHSIGYQVRAETLADSIETGISYNFQSSSEHGRIIDPLYIMFNAGSGENSADTYSPPSEGKDSLTYKMEKATLYYGDGSELVEERYSRILFEHVDDKFTDVTIKDTDEFKIKDVGVDKAEWWDIFHGKGDQVDKNTLDRFESVKAIEEVTDSVMDLGKGNACEKLKIGLHDYDAFNNYYQENKSKGTVYLFRYKISDYYSREGFIYKYNEEGRLVRNPSPGVDTYTRVYWDYVDTNAYFFQEEADIGFDIIDITLTNEQGEHVLGVVAKPIDVFPTPMPPFKTTDDNAKTPWSELLFWLKMIVGIIIIGFIIAALCILFPPIGTVFLYVIMLPFKALAWLFKSIGGLFHKRE